MSLLGVRVNVSPVAVTDTGFGIMFAFVISVGVVEQAVMLNIANDASAAVIMSVFFINILFYSGIGCGVRC